METRRLNGADFDLFCMFVFSSEHWHWFAYEVLSGKVFSCMVWGKTGTQIQIEPLQTTQQDHSKATSIIKLII